jgi:hypothetical protein
MKEQTRMDCHSTAFRQETMSRHRGCRQQQFEMPAEKTAGTEIEKSETRSEIGLHKRTEITFPTRQCRLKNARAFLA